MVDLTYISPGNDKTGNCFSFDIPAKVTCPGMTAACGDKCYAANLMRIYSKVNDKYLRNLEFANSNKFVRYMVDAIPRDCEFRIHVSGDFYSAEYVKKWIRVAKARPDVEFYAYTRSWQLGAIWKQLEKLHALNNININLSCDEETGKPTSEEYRWAYLTNDKGYDDCPSWLRRCDIVFRSASSGHKRRRNNALKRGEDPNKTAPLVHRIGEAPVCPFERGRDVDNFSCSKCRICIDKPQGVAIC